MGRPEEDAMSRMLRPLIGALGSGAAMLLLGAISARGAEIVVAEGLDTLHQAVAAANPGDTLVLPPGLYEVTHTVLIDKSLTLKGSSKNAKDAHIAAVDAEEFNFEEGMFTDPLDRGHILFATGGAGKVSFANFTV